MPTTTSAPTPNCDPPYPDFCIPPPPDLDQQIDLIDSLQPGAR